MRRQPAPLPPAPPPPPPPEPLTERELRDVGLLARSPVPAKSVRGVPLTAADARAFWTAHQGGAVDGARVREVGEVLDRALAACDGPQADRLPSHRLCFALVSTHKLLAGRFAKESSAP